MDPSFRWDDVFRSVSLKIVASAMHWNEISRTVGLETVIPAKAGTHRYEQQAFSNASVMRA
jgi:hypothetical protein